jgi:hypothetical protein
VEQLEEPDDLRCMLITEQTVRIIKGVGEGKRRGPEESTDRDRR